jgi:acyl-CoA dehydrogenase
MVARIGRQLESGASAFQRAVAGLLEAGRGDIRAAFAGSVPYLKLAGLVLSAWQLARAALAARTALDAGSPDGAFLTAKIATAAFFADHLLPQAGGLADAIAEGAPSVLALDEAQF